MSSTNAATGAASLVPPVPHEIPRPILVATDGTSGSLPALRAARLLADRLGAAVRAVSVVPPGRVLLPVPGLASMPGAPIDELVASRRDRLRDQMRHALGSATAWPFDVRSGIVSAEVADVARATGAQIVVTGLVHHGRVDRLLRGETPLAILNEAQVPVLAVPPGAERLPRTAVIAVDLTDASLDAAAFARPLVAEATTVHLVHVQTRLDVGSPMMAPGADRAYHDALRRAFDRVAAALELSPAVHVAVETIVGNVAHELLDFADQARADLIVTGHRRRPLIERFISRGTAARLFHGATRWLLMVPEDPRHRGRLAEGDESETNAWLKDRAVWPVFLQQFTTRNVGRAVALQVLDGFGAQTVVTGYPFLGIDYERETGRIDVMVGDESGTEPHLRHSVPRPTVIQVHRTPDGRDGALMVADRFGRLVLTFAG